MIMLATHWPPGTGPRDGPHVNLLVQYRWESRGSPLLACCLGHTLGEGSLHLGSPASCSALGPLCCGQDL